jgi:hypothetical protein
MRALRAYFGRAPHDDIARIREACDVLVLARWASPGIRVAMADTITVLADLVARGGISRHLAAAIVDDIGRCAPPEPAGQAGESAAA